MGKEPGSAYRGLKILNEAGESLEANGSIVLVHSSSRLVKAEGEIFPVSSWTAELPLANFTTWLWYSHFPNWVCECLNLNKQEAMTVLDNLGTTSCCELRQRKGKVWGLENGGKFCSFLPCARLTNEDYPSGGVGGETPNNLLFTSWLSHKLNVPA